ncbi:MAG: ASCH domain-containing protein [Halobacteria archaeon]|nr:ASCH domain-containing protein [Halobacteria archaeon]
MSEKETDTEAEDLLPAERLRQSALEGDVTQIHRGERHADEGDRFVIDGTTFEVVEVYEERLGDMTDEDARAEGSDSLEDYKRRVERAHGIEWDDDSTAVLHRFERV